MIQSEVVVCVASGPSVDYEQARVLNSFGGTIITVNRAFELITEPDIIYASDIRWWMEYYPAVYQKIAKEGSLCATLRNKVKSIARKHPDAIDELYEFDYLPGFGLSGDWTIKFDGNSGHFAVGIAAAMKPKKIILVGFDHKYSEAGNRHFHRDYERKKFPANAENLERWLESFDHIAKDAERLGIDLVNCSTDTAITSCRRGGLEEELE